MASNIVTGYGPRHRLVFDGDESKYELWEVKFMGHLRQLKIHSVISDVNQDGDDADGVTERKAQVFDELVQYLDDRSLSLIMTEARDDGSKAMEILRNHYRGNSKPRIISLYTELTSLKKSPTEGVTDYIIRAETSATALKTAGEIIADTLLVAMVLKGLSSEYRAFCTVITQKDTDISFSKFKVALKSYEETEKSHETETCDGVMSANFRRTNVKCFRCNGLGHKKADCRVKIEVNQRKSRWCDNCKSPTHDTNYCRRSNSTKSTVSQQTAESSNTDSHNFAFRVSDSHSCYSDVLMENLLVDCGATVHVINDKSKFVKLDGNFNPASHIIELADGSKQQGIVLCKGDAQVKISDNSGNYQNVILKDALCIPSYRQNIFSVIAATENGVSVNFSKGTASMNAPDGTVFDIKKDGRLYYLNSINPKQDISYTAKKWHEILGHCNQQDVIKLEQVVTGMKITDKSKFNCNTCATGKLTQHRNRAPDERAMSNLELVHCDLAGPIDPVAKDGYKYAISFVDDYSGITMIYMLQKKSDTVAATERFYADSAPYGKVRRLRCDNGGEFSSKDFKDLVRKNRTKLEYSAPYSPHQNGTVERSWRTNFDMARCLLQDAKLSKNMWAYALKTAVYIRNRCFNHRTGKTPYEIFTGKRPNLNNLHQFGTKCFAYIQIKKKLDPRAKQGIFVGYDGISPAYLLYFSNQNKVKRVRVVKFTDKIHNESEAATEQFVCAAEGDNQAEQVVAAQHSAAEPMVCAAGRDGQAEPMVAAGSDCELQPVAATSSEGACTAEGVGEHTATVPHRYPMRQHEPPKYLDDYVTSTKCTIDYCYRISDIPKTFHQAVNSSESSHWCNAMDEEVKSLYDNNTFDLVPLEAGMSVIGGRWVYTIKIGHDDQEQFKARYVAKGYTQVKDLNYHETFSPTARITSIRMLLQTVIQDDLVVDQLDVKTAYLNAEIDCDIFVDQPEGYEVTNSKEEKLVCKLKKSLYGLKQSGRNWNSTLHTFLLSENFKQSSADNCVYTRFNVVTKVKAIIIIWVDDMIVAASSRSALNCVKVSLCNKFKMKDMGQLSWFLGMEFKFDGKTIRMSQHKYLDKMINRFDLQNCNPKSVPCDLSVDKIIQNDPKEPCEIVGSLIYA